MLLMGAVPENVSGLVLKRLCEVFGLPLYRGAGKNLKVEIVRLGN